MEPRLDSFPEVVLADDGAGQRNERLANVLLSLLVGMEGLDMVESAQRSIHRLQMEDVARVREWMLRFWTWRRPSSVMPRLWRACEPRVPLHEDGLFSDG